jgi:hypothetical protein
MARQYEMSDKKRWTLINACSIAAEQAAIGTKQVKASMDDNAYHTIIEKELTKAAGEYGDMIDELQKFDRIILVDDGDDV